LGHVLADSSIHAAKYPSPDLKQLPADSSAQLKKVNGFVVLELPFPDIDHLFF
jgi:hypothetical protein